jgi:sporulation protein YlmC with PRC-barrel domain
MTTNETYGKLVKLSDVGQTVADKNMDLRGRQVVDKDGLKLGKIDALLIDDADRKVRFLEVESGGFLGIGERKSMIPIDGISTIGPDEVNIDQSGKTVAAVPTYDPALIDETVLGNTYQHYGFLPYWGTGYAYPGFPFVGEDD